MKNVHNVLITVLHVKMNLESAQVALLTLIEVENNVFVKMGIMMQLLN